MCQKVHHNCAYCGAHRFTLWEECPEFWKRYQHIVVDLEHFEDRPKVTDCKLKEDELRRLRLGGCPRLRSCASLVEYQRQRRRLTKRIDTVKDVKEVTKASEKEVLIARQSEQKAFADRWFRKRPIEAVKDSSLHKEVQDCDIGASQPAAVGSGGLLGQNLERGAQRIQPQDKKPGESLLFDDAETELGLTAASLASTVIESDSEAGSVEPCSAPPKRTIVTPPVPIKKRSS
jgi:hypothetical protein